MARYTQLLLLVALLAAPGVAAAGSLAMGYGEGVPGQTNVPVIVTGTNDIPIHGYSLALTFPPEALTLKDFSTVGTHIHALEPDFVAPQIDNQLGIATIAVLFVSFEPPGSATALPPVAEGAYPRILARLTFDVKSTAQGGAYPLELTDGIGTPANFNRFTQSGTSNTPSVTHGTFVVAGGNVLAVEKKLTFAGRAGLILFAYTQHPQPLGGFSVALTFEKFSLSMAADATFVGTSLESELESEIEAFNYDLDTNFTTTHSRAAATALFDLQMPFLAQTLPAELEPLSQSIIKYTFNVSVSADNERQFQDLILHDCAQVGSGCENAHLASDNRFIIGAESIGPRLVDGRIYFSIGNLTGRVIDSETKQGVSGVTVITDPDGFRATTQLNGSFQFNTLPPGRYALLFSRSGYYNQRHSTTQAGEEILVEGSELTDDTGDLPMFKVPSIPFIRGDVNGDSNIDLSDPISVLAYLFQGQGEPGCLEAANTNGDATVDLSDAIYLLSYLFSGGFEPPPPFQECEHDPGGDAACVVSNCL
jgi:hypothetical protein